MSSEFTAKLNAFTHEVSTAYAPLAVFEQAIDSIFDQMVEYYNKNDLKHVLSTSYYLKFAIDQWEKYFKLYCAFLEKNYKKVHLFNDGFVEYLNEKQRWEKALQMKEARHSIDEIIRKMENL